MYKMDQQYLYLHIFTNCMCLTCQAEASAATARGPTLATCWRVASRSFAGIVLYPVIPTTGARFSRSYLHFPSKYNFIRLFLCDLCRII